MREINSTRYGVLKVDERSIINFDEGIPGFDDEKQFAYYPMKEDSPFAYLQSTRTPDLSFIVIDPFVFFPDYDFEISQDDVEHLQFGDEDVPFVCNIVTITDGLESMTANLLAPVVVNWRLQRARQVILEGQRYHTRHAVFPNGVPKFRKEEK
ncbi:MAG: flagellar assembly protein FliW [Negativicutes bacterium]|nr:flagellar assembly protein FliW [Negativicutes bacterium]